MSGSLQRFAMGHTFSSTTRMWWLLSSKPPIGFEFGLGFDLGLRWFWSAIDWRIRGRQSGSFGVLALGLSLGTLGHDLL